jgi:hypothetical protein
MHKRSRRFIKTTSEWVDVEVEVEFEDVTEFIEDYASDEELTILRKQLGLSSNLHGSTMVDSMKIELLELAASKYSLEELESRLGNKFDLM